MDLVVDANILFSVLIKDGFTHTLLFNNTFHLFMPEYAFAELEKHKTEVLKKTRRAEDDFFGLLEILKKRIAIIPLEELTSYVEEAEKLTPDPDDMVYVALALKLDCAIWSNDKKLKEQAAIPVYHTHELARMTKR